jgi:hypothetical protein
MAIHEHTTIALYDDGGEQMGNYTMGEEEFRLIDGKHSVAFNVTEAADLIAFLVRVQDMQEPTPAPKPALRPVDLTKSHPGQPHLLRNGTVAVYEHRFESGHKVGDYWYYRDGTIIKGESRYDIIAIIPSDHSGPSGTACDTLPVGDQRDYGDERPDDDGFVTVHPRPRRDGPGLDVKALADLEGRN